MKVQDCHAWKFKLAKIASSRAADEWTVPRVMDRYQVIAFQTGEPRLIRAVFTPQGVQTSVSQGMYLQGMRQIAIVLSSHP